VAYIVECRSGNVKEATPSFGKIFGYYHEELKHVQQLYEPILRADLTTTLTHTHQVLDWIFKNEDVPALQDGAEFKYNVRAKSGRNIRLLRQTASCGKVDGKITHTLGVLTDISHWDSSHIPLVRALGPTASYFDNSIVHMDKLRAILSKRECEIIKLLAQGMTSRTIAGILHISIHTVDTHRRNMLHKLEAENTREMIYIARDINLIQ